MAQTDGRSGTELATKVLKQSRGAFVAVGVASAFVNMLYLTGSFYMLQVYDRVIPSQSIPSLIALSILAAMLYLFQGAFEIVRSRILVRISGIFDEATGEKVFKASLRAALSTKVDGDGLALIRDFDQVRTFLAGPGPSAFFDLPWLPFYIFLCFMFHPVIGYIALVGALALIVITFLTNRSTKMSSMFIAHQANHRGGLASAALRNTEVIRAMGMTDRIATIWLKSNQRYRSAYTANADTHNVYATLSKIFRVALQSAVLAAGAVLVIEKLASGGIIIAASILISRSLAPIEQVIGNWRGFVSARQSWKRLRNSLDQFPDNVPPLKLPAPFQNIAVDALASGPPGGKNAIIAGVTFALTAGNAVGVIGPSGSGKSSLARAIAGVWPTLHGSVRLDGASMHQWDEETLGNHIGYLPQDVELFSGSIAQNISRFHDNPSPDQVITAAMDAHVHELILNLPKGYDTEIGPGGSMLSAGQRQRIALARALYRNPFLIILDEPNSNLDADGENALTKAIAGIRSRGGIVIIIAHRPSALAAANYVLFMKDGRIQNFGLKDEVLAQILREPTQAVQEERSSNLKVVSDPQERAS